MQKDPAPFRSAVQLLCAQIDQADRYSRAQKTAIREVVRKIWRMKDGDEQLDALLECRAMIPAGYHGLKTNLEKQALALIAQTTDPARRLALYRRAQTKVLENTDFYDELADLTREAEAHPTLGGENLKAWTAKESKKRCFQAFLP